VPSDVAEAMKPEVVELTALCNEEVCRVSACVSLSRETMLLLASVASAERLKVMPSSVVLVAVLLRLPGEPTGVDSDGSIGEDQVEFAPSPNLVDDVSVSLAGTSVPDTFADKVANISLDVRIFV